MPIQRFVRGGMPPHPSTVAAARRRGEAGPRGGMPLHPALQRKGLHPGHGGVSGAQRREDVHAFQTPQGFLERSGPGDPLPAGVKQRMERYFSADFSDVRVHVGPEARSIGALAFTLGSDIYFSPEHYRPGTRAGQELLGHELTHVVQQREGRVANPFGDGVAVVQDFELEAEADRHGKAVAQGRLAAGCSRTAGSSKRSARTIATRAPITVLQRMNSEFLDEEGLLPGDAEDLNEIAMDFNKSYSGKLESRHTQAVTLDSNYNMMLFTQRWMSSMDDVVLQDPLEFGADEVVIGDQKDDENIHAEMLAISWYLQGNTGKPTQIGVSKAVCARCSVVLSYFGIPHFSDGTKTKNWTSPWRHAEQYPPKALKGKIPEIVRKGKEHQYASSDWR